MKPDELKVTFQPTGRTIYVLPGTVLLEAAGRAGIILQTPCGGRGTCGKCKIRIMSGSCRASADTSHALSEEQICDGYRLACQSHVDDHLIVEVPRESRFETSDRILTDDAGHDAALHPVVNKRFFSIQTESGHVAESDVARFQNAVGTVTIPFHLLQRLPGFLRGHDWKGTAVVVGNQLVGLEAGDTSDVAYGVAIDLGTTTVVATLLNLVSGEEEAVASSVNPQVGFGDDVIARISRVRENHSALTEMQHVILEAVNRLIRELCEQSHITTPDIYDIVVAGNSTMQQIFCGLDPSALGEMPFAQVFDAPLSVRGRTLGIAANLGAEVFVFPQIGGFVGGDTVAGMLAARMDESKGPTVLIDIGTNGEIALAHDGRLLTTSTAAGPAFEGARIKQGMRAMAGAIEKVIIQDDVLVNVIGNAAPVGLCGTALIDAVAELLRHGLIDETGRILSKDEAPDGISASLLDRLVTENRETRFLLAGAGTTASQEGVYLWQKDVRELQLATGAIRAGINILLRRAGLCASDLHQILLAGAFGNFIRRNNARRIGLLPQIPCDRIRFIGNAASAGAKLALLSTEERQRAQILQTKSEHLDLSLDPEFQMEFGMAMIFPGADIDTCADG